MKYLQKYVEKTGRIISYMGILTLSCCVAPPYRQVGDLSIIVRGMEGREMKVIESPLERNQTDSLE